MTTAEIEELYIKHAADFRELLGHAKALCVFPDNSILYPHKDQSCDWRHSHGGGLSAPRRELAVAAMTGHWPKLLEEKYGQRLDTSAWSGMDRYAFYAIGSDGTRTTGEGASLPEAICAAGKALAAEKRAATSQVGAPAHRAYSPALDGPDPLRTIRDGIDAQNKKADEKRAKAERLALRDGIDCLWAEVRRINHNLNLPPMAHCKITGIEP